MRTLGAWSYARAHLGPMVDQGTAQQRFTICMQCQQVDPNGRRLLRMANGKPHCGQPRLQNIWRDEQLYGCGCPIAEKIWYANTGCPRGQW